MAGSGKKNCARQMLIKSAERRGGSGAIRQRLRKVYWSSIPSEGSSDGGGGSSGR